MDNKVVLDIFFGLGFCNFVQVSNDSNFVAHNRSRWSLTHYVMGLFSSRLLVFNPQQEDGLGPFLFLMLFRKESRRAYFSSPLNELWNQPTMCLEFVWTRNSSFLLIDYFEFFQKKVWHINLQPSCN